MSHPSPYHGLILIRQHDLEREAAGWRLGRSVARERRQRRWLTQIRSYGAAAKRGSSWAFRRRESAQPVNSARLTLAGQLIDETAQETRQLLLIEVERAEASRSAPDADDEDPVAWTP
jgi:hypothetical protein